VHLKFGLIRGMAFGASGFIRGEEGVALTVVKKHTN
jgi:hypothetical protein